MRGDARYARLAPYALCLVALSGCAGRPCPTQPFVDADALLSAYRDMRAPARVLRAEARVDRRDAQGRIRGTVLMYLERPDHVRFDAQTQFGPAAILTSDGERFALTDHRENRFLYGPTCPENIERMLGLRFHGSEVTRLLLGETPRIEGTTAGLACREGRYGVTVHAADGRRQELEFEVREDDLASPPGEQRLRLRRSEVFGPDGGSVWRVTYDDYRFVEDPLDRATPHRGVVLPFELRFEDRAGADTRVRFTRIELNVEAAPGVFTQEPAPGLTQELVECP